jgi:membrane fusion protein (multidrug efflux system)
MKKILLGVGLVIVIGGGLAAIKTLQIGALMSAEMPPESATIATAVAQAEEWPDTIPAVGSVSAVQGVMIAPEISGTVTEINFESGATVQPGDLLVKLETASEAAQLRAAEAQAQLAQLNAERARKLHEGNAVSQAEIDTAEASLQQAQAQADGIRATLAKKHIRAPFAGKLGLRLVNLGEQLPVGQSIVSLQALAPVYVDFSLPQQELARLQTGLKVRVTTDTYPGQIFEGELTAINPDLDLATRSIRSRAKVGNADERLRAGMFVNVAVLLPEAQAVLAVPATAVVSAPYGDSVFIVSPDPQAATNLVVQQAFIRTGRTRGDFVSVETGLKAGDRVATAGIFKLRNGLRVQENNTATPKASETPTPPNG